MHRGAHRPNMSHCVHRRAHRPNIKTMAPPIPSLPPYSRSDRHSNRQPGSSSLRASLLEWCIERSCLHEAAICNRNPILVTTLIMNSFRPLSNALSQWRVNYCKVPRQPNAAATPTATTTTTTAGATATAGATTTATTTATSTATATCPNLDPDPGNTRHRQLYPIETLTHTDFSSPDSRRNPNTSPDTRLQKKS